MPNFAQGYTGFLTNQERVESTVEKDSTMVGIMVASLRRNTVQDYANGLAVAFAIPK